MLADYLLQVYSTKLSELYLLPFKLGPFIAWFGYNRIHIYLYNNDSINTICIAGLQSWWSWNINITRLCWKTFTLTLTACVDTKQLLAQIPNTVGSTVRTSYIICDAQWQQEIVVPLFKNHYEFQDGNKELLNRVQKSPLRRLPCWLST